MWLLLPGSRLFPDRVEANAVSEEELARVAASVNAELIARRDTLRAALAGAACKQDGTLLMPNGMTIEGLLPPIPGQPGSTPGSRTQADPNPILPPASERVRIAGTSGTEETSLLEMIEERTAMVVSTGQEGGTGSGFFISPDLLMTNHHVVADAQPGTVFVVNEALGGSVPATVLRSSGTVSRDRRRFCASAR